MKRPDEAELLAWLDGELTPERRAEIQQQLETDWELRTTLARLEQRIGKYVEATAHQSPAEVEPFDDFWQQFAPRLDALMASRNPSRRPAIIQSLLPRLAKMLAPPRYGWRLASVVSIALFITAGLILYLSLSTRVRPVSAEELLHRSISGEELRVRQLAEPVVYRKLQVKRVGASEPVVWESWNDAQHNQFRQRVADKQGLRFLRANEKQPPAIIAELEQIFRANHFDPHRPLSARAFAEWRKAIKLEAETVTEVKEGWRLTATRQEPYAVNAITEASLVVRKTDWHAVVLQLRVQGENELRDYELTETAYEVLPLQALTVFADLPPVPSPVPSVAPQVSPLPTVTAASPLPTLALPSRAALQAAEVAALYVLHQAQADLGEQIEVVVDEGRQIVVRGLVQTAERKEELVQALRRIALVSPQIQTIEEAMRQAQRATNSLATNETAPATSEITVTSGQSATSVNPFQQKLIEHFGGRKGLSEAERQEVNARVTQFYNAVEADASAALAEAWALRRLQERFAAQNGAEFDATSRQRLEEIQNNHLSRLRQRARNLQARLRPLLVAVAGDVPAVAPAIESTRQAQILAAFRAIEQARNLTDQLIAGNPTTSLPQTARALLMELTRLDAVLTSLEKN